MKEEDFELNYAKNSGLTVEKLHELGQFAVPCDCDFNECPGWAMLSKRNLKDHVNLYIK